MHPPRQDDMHDESPDYYEVLQISPNADPDMISRVYRLLAQRLHPDNAETGDADKFRQLTSAYAVLSDPEQRARYDVVHGQRRQARWRLVSAGRQARHDFDAERVARLTLLEVLYTRRKTEPHQPGMLPVELESLIGQPREHMEFTIWFLAQKGLIQRNDSSKLVITAAGVEHLEDNYQALNQQKLLDAAPGVT